MESCGREVKEFGEYVAGKLAREFGADFAAASFDERFQQLDGDGADRRLQPLHLFLGEERIQRAAIRRVVGRIEMQGRAPASECNFRDYVLNRRDERIGLAQGADHVVIAQQGPEAVPRVAMRHRAPGAHVAIQIVRAAEIFDGQRIEVVGQARVHVGSLMERAVHSERFCRLCSETWHV